MSVSTRFQVGAALLIASLGTFARASDAVNGAADIKSCMAEYRVVFRTEGHPAKSNPFLRHELNAAPECANAIPTPLYLTVFADAPGGTSLLQGENAVAIEEIQQSKRPSAIASLPLTNLCAAQIASRDWADARATCDAALEAALLDRVRAPSWPYAVRDRYKDFVAVAYSNRAVLLVLSNDMTAGEDDLVRARKVAPRAPFVKRNLTATRLVRAARMIASSQPTG